MTSSRYVRVLYAMVLIESILASKINNSQLYCDHLRRDPYFDSEQVIEKPWRIFYSWNMQLNGKCFYMMYRNATPEIVNKIFDDMHEYLEAQPEWNAAILVLSMGRSNHEMLLIADQGSAGQFVGVPNVARDGNILPNKNSVPLFKIHMKLYNNGSYLVIADCSIGVSTLAAHRDTQISRVDIERIVSTVGFGEGFLACAGDVSGDERPHET